jgi:ABC-type Fe3+/spermidine/putrescine transport system ATPase subunit
VKTFPLAVNLSCPWQDPDNGSQDLHIHQISKELGTTTVLASVSLTLKAGTISALLGASGSGKSTLLHLIAGILTPDQGDITLGRRSLLGIPIHRRRVGLVPQNRLLFPHLSVGENIAFGLKMQGVNRLDREAQVVQMLERVQLAGFAHRDPRSLSGGQAQRVALARALVVKPRVLLLDEPLSALDAHLRQEMQELIRSLHSETHTTTLIVTHDQQEAVALSSHLALLHQGHLLQQGSPTDFFYCPQSLTVARFFGGVNVWPGRGEGQRVWIHGIPFTLGTPFQGEGWVTIRPELVRVWQSPPSQINTLPMQIQHRTSTGLQWRLYLHHPCGLALQAWVSHSPSQEQVWVEFPPDALWMMPPETPL